MILPGTISVPMKAAPVAPPFVACKWSQTDKDPSVSVLSTVKPDDTFSGGNNAGVRGTKSVIPGQKVYYECKRINAGFRFAIGFCNTNYGFIGIPGEDNFPSSSWNISQDGTFHANANGGLFIYGGLADNYNVDLAFNVAARLIWVRVNNSAIWNEGSSNASIDDVTNGIKGQTIDVNGTFMQSGPYFPVGYSWTSDGGITNFGTGLTTGFARPIPPGFTAI